MTIIPLGLSFSGHPDRSLWHFIPGNHSPFTIYLLTAQSGKLTRAALQASVDRIVRLKDWLAENSTTPDLGVIRCARHLEIADEIAEKSITVVRDEQKQLPVRLEADKRIAVIIPVSQDLTPADTSSYIQPKLAESIRMYHARTDEFEIPYAPDEQDPASVLEKIRGCDLVVMGTINACTEERQARFVRLLLQTGRPVIVIAMRLPYDLAAFPQASTFLCTYSILEPSMRAVAKAVFDYGEMAGPSKADEAGPRAAGIGFWV